MLELFAVTALFSALNFTAMQGAIWTYENTVDENTTTVVEVIECDREVGCEEEAPAAQ